jgi:hypothetical protein
LKVWKVTVEEKDKWLITDVETSCRCGSFDTAADAAKAIADRSVEYARLLPDGTFVSRIEWVTRKEVTA